MRRRRFLGAAGAASLGALAGCTGLFDLKQRAFSAPPLVKDRPDAVYYPTHVEQMQMSGMQKRDGYACALSYTYPHRFWLVTGTHESEVKIQPGDTMHVMPVVWHVESGQVVPDVAPKLRVSEGGNNVLSDAPWPMLSQPMGFHYGDNISLPGEATYDVSVHVGSPTATRIGSLANAPDSLSFDFTLDYTRQKLESISWHKLPDEKGQRGAIAPMKMKMLPSSAVPKPSGLPGHLLGTGTSGDATFAVTVLDDATRFGGGESQSYLAVSPRSPHNRYQLPSMGLSATASGTSHDLAETLDPDLGLHYGVVVDAAPSSVTVHVDTPPQVARHEGYETAFLGMPDVSVHA